MVQYKPSLSLPEAKLDETTEECCEEERNKSLRDERKAKKRRPEHIKRQAKRRELERGCGQPRVLSRPNRMSSGFRHVAIALLSILIWICGETLLAAVVSSPACLTNRRLAISKAHVLSSSGPASKWTSGVRCGGEV